MFKNIGLINNFANIQPPKNCSYLFFFNDLCLQNIPVCIVLWFQSNFRVQNDSKNKKIALERNWLTMIHKTIVNIIPIITNKSLSYIIECLLFTLYNLFFTVAIVKSSGIIAAWPNASVWKFVLVVCMIVSTLHTIVLNI